MRSLLAYDSFGEGPHHVVALHGWFGDQGSFAPLYDALSPTEFRWICPSYRGYGGSRALQGEYTVDEIADDVLALADSLGIQQFSLVGHSMGGKVAMRILANAPSRVRRIVAVAAVPASGVPFDQATYAQFERAVSDAQAARAIVGFSVGMRLSPAWVDRVAQHPKMIASDEAFAGYLPSWARGDFHTETIGHPVPLLVVIGEFDGAINQALMRATYLRWHPNARLEIMSNAGHYPMNETPVALATAIESFLR